VSFPYVRAVFEVTPTWSTPAEFAVLVTLANFADKNGFAYPSKPTIARRVGLKPRQVWNLTRALEAQGLLVIQPGAGPRRCDRFLLTFDGSKASQTLAAHCQGESERTLAIANHDPGNGMPRPWQPIATNPKDPKEIQKRAPVSLAASALSLVHTEKEKSAERGTLPMNDNQPDRTTPEQPDEQKKKQAAEADDLALRRKWIADMQSNPKIATKRAANT
jgi:DNA-binding MarR family transcriptional regulator